MKERYFIPASVFDVIRNHAFTASGGWEVGGELLGEQDRIVTYRPCRNLSTEAGFYEPPAVPREPWFVCHTHPERQTATPSAGDLAWMRAHGAVRVAVFAPDGKPPELVVWHLWESDEPGAARPVPVVVQRHTSRGSPLRRPGRRR